MQFCTPAFLNQVLAGNTPRDFFFLICTKFYNTIVDFLIMQIYF